MRFLSFLLVLAVAAPGWAQASHETLALADFAVTAPAEGDSVVAEGPPGSAPNVEAAVIGGPVVKAYDVEAAPAFYVIGAGVSLRALPEAGAAVLASLRTRAGVRVLDYVGNAADPNAWWLVESPSGRGYVRASELSNVWIRVDKSDRMVYVYRGTELLRELPADVSMSDEDKVRRSELGESEHYRTPEGTFYVTRRHDTSAYYRAFVLSYPNPVHARRGLEAGYITRAQYDAIVRADELAVEPPMNTPLGGLIELHGHGSGRQRAWTRGCIALRNVHMDELWAYVEVGTPVVIEP